MGRVSMLCNDAELFQQEGAWKVEGDPTEGALYPFATKLGADRQAELAAYPRIDAIPFESEHKFMATLHRSAGGKEILLVKGAPEVILEHCDRQQTSGGVPASLGREHFMEASDKLAAQGERVLALAWLENPGVRAGSLSPGDLPKTLVLLGLIGLLDPPRKEAIEAVEECRSGGIRVTMITGDHRITATAIAKMLGIGDGKTAITGAEIEEMNTTTLREKVRDVDVFARASPEHKLRLVKAIQANKQIVAMTGDGVNDAPALKKADIGVAMGIKGTEVTKEAAEMILADDNFASITAAVKEGRTVYNNIEKAILFMLPTNVAQALVIAVAIFLGFTMPITAPQVLWVNMVTSVALGLVISFEPHELDVMNRPPRAADRPILTGFGIWRVIFVGLALLAFTLWAFFWMKSQGASDSLARTVAVNPTLPIGDRKLIKSTAVARKSPLHLLGHGGCPLSRRRGDAWRRLGRQIELELLRQKLLFGIEFGVAAQDQCTAIGGREVDVEHLDSGELVEHGSWGEAGRQRLELGAQRDVKAVGQEGDEDVRFDAVLKLVVDRTELQIVLEILERDLDLDELDIELPQMGRLSGAQIGAQQIAPLAAARLAQLVAIEREAESGVVGRHFNIDQTPCRSGLGPRRAELHEQFLAREVLHRGDLFETRP